VALDTEQPDVTIRDAPQVFVQLLPSSTGPSRIDGLGFEVCLQMHSLVIEGRRGRIWRRGPRRGLDRREGRRWSVRWLRRGSGGVDGAALHSGLQLHRRIPG